MSSKQFTFLIIATCVTLLIWVVANLFLTPAATEVSPETQQLLSPVSPNFDQDTINGI